MDMSHPWTLSLAGLVPFLIYFIPALVLVVCFGAVYSRITPHNEFGLIKAGNSSAAIAFGGSLIGFVLPLCTAIVHAVSLLDFIICGGDLIVAGAPFHPRIVQAHQRRSGRRRLVRCAVFRGHRLGECRVHDAVRSTL